MRTLADRSWQLDTAGEEREVTQEDLMALGYGKAMAQRIVELLGHEDVLDHYIARGKRGGCIPLTRVSLGYPLRLRKRLGLDSPGVLWAKGNMDILNSPMIVLVGSRDLKPENRRFAEKAGRQAALQGYTLVSGNARGADRTAQEACLAAGGKVVCVVADELIKQPTRDGVLYLSEDDYDQAFSAQRAISRNRVIHALGEKTLVAQCSLRTGGTWDGTVKNLRHGWSDVFCFRDGSDASEQLRQLGAELIDMNHLADLPALRNEDATLFDQ
jgi:predicted Rossmann fold nucleotide-binding protein DprA/Smf involved in DNA uptake